MIKKKSTETRKVTKYNYLPKRHVTAEFKEFFKQQKPGVEMSEETLAEFELYPRHPKSSILPINVTLPKNNDEF